jgi:hypothetical protein
MALLKNIVYHSGGDGDDSGNHDGDDDGGDGDDSGNHDDGDLLYRHGLFHPCYYSYLHLPSSVFYS